MPTQANLITKFANLTTDSIHFGQAKANNRGGKNVPLYDSKGNKLVIALPTTPCWGMNENVDEQSGRKSYNVNLRLSNDSEMTKKFQAIEDWVVAQCVENGRDWFGKPNMSEDVVRALFYPILKYPKDRVTQEPDTSRDPSVKLKVGYWEGDFKVELYSMTGSPLFTQTRRVDDETPMDLVPMNSDIKALVQCDGLWFTAGRCGVTFKLLQAKVEEPVRLEGGCFLDSDDEETNDVAEEVAAVVQSSASANSDGEEDENEDNDAVNTPTEPEKPKRKKRQVKKKASEN